MQGSTCQHLNHRTRLDHFEDDVALAPQGFEPVELARLFAEEVDNDIAVIQQRPAAAAVNRAFDAEGADLLFELETLQQLVGDGAGLALVVNRGNHEVIGEGGLLVNVEQDNVGGLFILDNVDDVAGKGDAIQKVLL